MPFTDDEMAVAVAIFAIGGMIGALPAGIIADVIGRYIHTHNLQLARSTFTLSSSILRVEFSH